MRTDPHALALGELVAARDLEAIGKHLTDDVRLRALLPGGPIELQGRPEFVAKLDDWFGEYDAVVLEEADGELVGDRLLVHYRLRFEPEPVRVLTQTWVASVNGEGLIFHVDLVCSGFRETT